MSKPVPVKCRECKKTPKNCTCTEFRLSISQDGTHGFVYADNVATEPVKGQAPRYWQARKNARIWRSPTYIDGFGPILQINLMDGILEVQDAIYRGVFNLAAYYNREGFYVRPFDKSICRRLGFLRRAERDARAIGSI